MSGAPAQAQTLPLPLLFTHPPITLPADAAALHGQVLSALAHTAIFHRALGKVRPRTIALLENSFPAADDQRIEDIVEAATAVARAELKKRTGVQLVISIFAASPNTDARTVPQIALDPSQSSRASSADTVTERNHPSSRLTARPLSWLSQAVSLANQAYTHGYTLSGYGPHANEGRLGHEGADSTRRSISAPSAGAGEEIPFEQWIVSVKVVSFKTEHERSKAFQSASKQLSAFLAATIDFVDRYKTHLPALGNQDALLPFPIRISAGPIA